MTSHADITIKFSDDVVRSVGDSLLMRMAVNADRHPGYCGAIFRRTMPQAIDLWDRTARVFPAWDAVADKHFHEWRWPNQSSVNVCHLQRLGDVLNHAGRRYAEIAFCGITAFDQCDFWYMLSRLRSTCGLTPRFVATYNPVFDCDMRGSWVAGLAGWWLNDGGSPVVSRVGKKRYFVRDGEGVAWCDKREAGALSICLEYGDE